MLLTIPQIKTKWNLEKDSYENKEIGDGVQKFVKDVLKSEEVFNLKEGLNVTPLERRKYEFKEEEGKKERRRADIVIFINPEIVIPLEVEKYKDIESGNEQILQYQLDWDKKYGILTDGYTWRFYNNNLYREFNLDLILKESTMFFEFWREYIKPEFYYLSFFEPKGQQVLLKEFAKLPVETFRQIFFEDITKLIRSMQLKLNIEGYFKGLNKKEKEKRAIEITYAYIIQFILYKTLVDNEFEGFGAEFEDTVKTIHDCLKAKQYGKILGLIDGISIKISQNIYRPFAKEQQYITNTLLELIRNPKNELHEVSPWLDIFIFIKKYDFSNVRNEIFGYIYENYLKELYEEEKRGQYFTDPAVVNFMLQQIGYTPEIILKRYKSDNRSISLIDPACGSGTFLYSAVNTIINTFDSNTKEKSILIEEIINKNIFGLDIAEFPLYLAEMNILMRTLPVIINEKFNNPVDKKIKVFLTKDSVYEFMNVRDINEKGDQLTMAFKDIDLGYDSYVREECDIKEMKRSMENRHDIQRRRFDFVIGNPPYVSYNECAKQKVLIMDKIKSKEVRLNDIYGINLHSIPGNRKKYSPKPNLFNFFIALGIVLLKDNGKLCYIIPQTILVNTDMDVIRYHLAKFTTIEIIITFSDKMFVGRGLKQNKPIATSSLIFVLKKGTPSIDHEVEVINYSDSNEDVEQTLDNILANKKVNKQKIAQKELLKNVNNWSFIKQGKVFLDFFEEYKKNTDDMSMYYNHLQAEHKFKSRFYFDKGLVFPKKTIHNKQDVSGKDEVFSIVKFDKKRLTPNIMDLVVRTKDIRVPRGSQGIEVYRKEFKIVWSYMNFNHFYYTDQKIILPYNFVIIASDNQPEIFYLYSLLNSRLQKTIIDKLFKLEQEDKLSILLGIKLIKGQIRVPKIGEDQIGIKEEIIKRTRDLFEKEKDKLSDVVDFSGVIMQKFDRVKMEGSNIILHKEGKKIKCKIKKSEKVVKRIVEEIFDKGDIMCEQDIILTELKSLPVIDREGQMKIKDYLDDLVFALYFNIKIPALGIDKAMSIKAKCKQNENYKVINIK